MTRNVVLLVLDSVRKDYYDRFAPRLRSASDCRFERGYAASSWSLPSHASILTGQLASEHGVHPKGTPDYSSIPATETFLSALPDHTSVGVSANVFASEDFGFDEFFDEFVQYTEVDLFQRGVKPADIQRAPEESPVDRYVRFLSRSLSSDHPIRSIGNGLWGLFPWKHRLSRSSMVSYSNNETVRGICDQIERVLRGDDGPHFVLANVMDAHSPFEPLSHLDESLHSAPDGWHSNKIDTREGIDPNVPFTDEQAVEHYRDLYASSIDYIDRVVSAFVERVTGASTHETTVVVTSDHGEDLGYDFEDAVIGHSSMDHSLVHVPLDIINPPDGYPSEVTDLVSHLELGTVLGRLARGEAYPEAVQRSYAPAEAVQPVGMERNETNDIDYYRRMLRTVVFETDRLQWDSMDNQLKYELTIGFPTTERSVDAPPPAVFEDADERYFPVSIGQYYEAHAGRSPEDLDAQTRRKLEDLGYL